MKNAAADYGFYADSKTRLVAGVGFGLAEGVSGCGERFLLFVPSLSAVAGRRVCISVVSISKAEPGSKSRPTRQSRRGPDRNTTHCLSIMQRTWSQVSVSISDVHVSVVRRAGAF